MDGIKIITAAELRAMAELASGPLKECLFYQIETELIRAARSGNMDVEINCDFPDEIISSLEAIGCTVEGRVSEDAPMEEHPYVKDSSIKIKW